MKGTMTSRPRLPGERPSQDGPGSTAAQEQPSSQATKLQPRLAWTDFLLQRREAHLISAVVLPPRTPNHLRRLHNMMDRLIVQHGPASAFATAIVREDNVVRIDCGFAGKADADVLARRTNARRAANASGWSSHRSFRLSADKEV